MVVGAPGFVHFVVALTPRCALRASRSVRSGGYGPCMGLGEPLFLGVKLSTFQTFGILGFVRFGVSIWVKYLAVLHHLVWHRSSKRIAAGRSRKVASLRSKHATKWDCYPRRQELTKIQDRASLSDATTCSVDLDASGREKEVKPCPMDTAYAGSCKRTSQNFSSTHSGE